MGASAALVERMFRGAADMTEIVPCRMCEGREDVIPPQISLKGGVKWIGCVTPGCWCMGPERLTESEAIAAWNELMQPSAQATPEPKLDGAEGRSALL